MAHPFSARSHGATQRHADHGFEDEAVEGDILRASPYQSGEADIHLGRRELLEAFDDRLQFALLQQNLHLVHYLWPSVPFYNYARLYRALHPVLRAEGSRIEGLMVGPYKRAIAERAEARG